MKNWKIGLGVPPQPAPKPARLPVSAAELARIGIPARKIPRSRQAARHRRLARGHCLVHAVKGGPF